MGKNCIVAAQVEIQRIGFFHFGVNHAHPIEELKRSLGEAQKDGEISNSLIVLPEGFNLSVTYGDASAQESLNDPDVLLDLATIAEGFAVVFLAGLIVEESGGPKPPYSSAFLIDSCTEPILLCRKRNKDNAPTRYTPALESYDIENPVRYRNCSIAALICMDAFQQDAVDVDRHSQLMTELGRKPVDFGVLCIPAHVYLDNEGLAQGWGSNYVVLANSYSNWRRKSYIAKCGIIEDQFTASGSINRIVTKEVV